MGGLKLDPVTHRLSGNSQSLQIGPTEFRLLHFFMTHPERVFSRSQLLDQVWGDHVFVEERTVDVHIRRLRKALEPSGHDAHVETVRQRLPLHGTGSCTPRLPPTMIWLRTFFLVALWAVAALLAHWLIGDPAGWIVFSVAMVAMLLAQLAAAPGVPLGPPSRYVPAGLGRPLGRHPGALYRYTAPAPVNWPRPATPCRACWPRPRPCPTAP